MHLPQEICRIAVSLKTETRGFVVTLALGDNAELMIKSTVDNNLLPDTKNILSRLVLQKLLQHEACKFLDKSKYEELSACFLSEVPDKDIKLNFKLQPHHTDNITDSIIDKWNNGIVESVLRWVERGSEKTDTEGNVWKTYQLKISSSVALRSNASVQEFAARSECMIAIASILSEIYEMAGHPLQFKVLNNDQRIARDIKQKHDVVANLLSNFIRWDSELYRGLRAGGKARTFARERYERFAHVAVTPGVYCFDVNFGSHRSPRIKKYSVTIKENPLYLCVIKRIS